MTATSSKAGRNHPARRVGALSVAAALALAAMPAAGQQGRSDAYRRLLDQLQSGRIIELNSVWDAQSPLVGFNSPYAMALVATHRGTSGMIPGGIAFAGDLMYFSGQHGAPTIDALGHISNNMKLYGGLDAAASESSQGLLKLGIETYPKEKFVNRGVLLDVARFKNAETLAPGYEITAADLEATAKAQGVEVRAGDSLLIRTGYGKFFATDKAKYTGLRPGPGEGAARWLAQQKVFLAGADQLTFDVFPEAGSVFPAHRILIADNGIYIVENLNLEELGQALSTDKVYEFPVVVNPLRIKGATASPLNMFAVLPR